GQDSIILLFLLAIAARLLSRGRDFAAGLIVGLGLFRFPLALPIAGMFVLWKNWRFVAGFAASAVALCCACWYSMPNYIHAHCAIASGDAKADVVHSMANLHGLIFTSFKGAPTAALWILLVAFSFALAYFAFRVGVQRSAPEQLDVSIVLGSLVSYHSLIYDLAILLVPITRVLDERLADETLGGSRRYVFRLGFLMFVAPVTASFLPDRFWLVGFCLLAFIASFYLRHVGPNCLHKKATINHLQRVLH